MMAPVAAEMLLAGDAYGRGLQQARMSPGHRAAVHAAILSRIEPHRALLADAERQVMLRDMVALAERHTPHAYAEAQGVADGWGLAFDDLMAFLHLPVFLDIEEARAREIDGCSSFIARRIRGGVVLAKNRDYRGEHVGLQILARHVDPAIAGGSMLSVGSLGAVSAFSSGINAAGFGLTDTQVPTRDHGIGVSRYLLMSELLTRCANVPDALAMIDAMPHAGGGTLLFADAAGDGAVVELGHARQAIERLDAGAFLARTNHHLDTALGPLTLTRDDEPMGGSSPARLATLRRVLVEGAPLCRETPFVRALLGSRDDECGRAGLCREGQDGDATTISGVMIAPSEKELYFCAGKPCSDPWHRYAL